MPTFSVETRFQNELARLKQWEKDRFSSAWRDFRDALLQCEVSGNQGLPRFPASLRVKDVSGHPGIWELTWAPDGRCTWEYGAQVQPGKFHINWRRIGGHEIFADP